MLYMKGNLRPLIYKHLKSIRRAVADNFVTKSRSCFYIYLMFSFFFFKRGTVNRHVGRDTLKSKRVFVGSLP